MTHLASLREKVSTATSGGPDDMRVLVGNEHLFVIGETHYADMVREAPVFLETRLRVHTNP